MKQLLKKQQVELISQNKLPRDKMDLIKMMLQILWPNASAKGTPLFLDELFLK
jgi:hypothetical protein